jgi:hypothetical protein
MRHKANLRHAKVGRGDFSGPVNGLEKRGVLQPNILNSRVLIGPPGGHRYTLAERALQVQETPRLAKGFCVPTTGQVR